MVQRRKKKRLQEQGVRGKVAATHGTGAGAGAGQGYQWGAVIGRSTSSESMDDVTKRKEQARPGAEQNRTAQNKTAHERRETRRGLNKGQVAASGDAVFSSLDDALLTLSAWEAQRRHRRSLVMQAIQLRAHLTRQAGRLAGALRACRGQHQPRALAAVLGWLPDATALAGHVAILGWRCWNRF